MILKSVINRNTILYTGLSMLTLCFLFREEYLFSLYVFVLMPLIFITDIFYNKEEASTLYSKKFDTKLETIKKEVVISNKSNSKFINKIFENKIEFNEDIYTKKIEFKNCIFNNKIDISQREFKNKLRFHNCVFKQTIETENASFFELIDFYRSEFQEHQKFLLNDFYNISIFSETVFKKSAIFRHCKINPSATYISFEKALFENGLDISNSNFWCTLQVFGIKITNTIPDKSILEEYEFSHYFPEETISSEKRKHTLKGIRESYRRIKQEFRKNENHIEAGDFHFHEMIVFEEELDIELPRKSIYYSKNRRKNKIIIYFNRISNNHKKNWVKGLLFTLIAGLCFYFLFILALVLYNYPSHPIQKITINEFIPHYFEFLNPTLWTKYKPFEKNTSSFGALAYTMFLLGRIIVGYGYYQTIQAFRKYGKN